MSKDWPHDNMKKAGFNGYTYDFSTDYNTIDVNDIKDIHKHLMKKNGIAQKCLSLLNKYLFQQ